MTKTQLWKVKGTYTQGKTDGLGTGWIYFTADDYREACERALVVIMDKTGQGGNHGVSEPDVEHLEQRGEVWVP